MATLNVGMKINRAITGATTVNANCYAMVTYYLSAIPTNTSLANLDYALPPITRVFGAGQSIPSSISVPTYARWDGAGNPFPILNFTFSLQGGVELINTI
jgi:hypothetical protein